VEGKYPIKYKIQFSIHEHRHANHTKKNLHSLLTSHLERLHGRVCIKYTPFLMSYPHHVENFKR